MKLYLHNVFFQKKTKNKTHPKASKQSEVAGKRWLVCINKGPDFTFWDINAIYITTLARKMSKRSDKDVIIYAAV